MKAIRKRVDPKKKADLIILELIQVVNADEIVSMQKITNKISTIVVT